MTIHDLIVTHIHMTLTQANIERNRQGDLTRKKNKHGRRHHNKDKGIIILI